MRITLLVAVALTLVYVLAEARIARSNSAKARPMPSNWRPIWRL